MITGYTSGVFDLFHVGHLNLLRNARGLCDRLVVGVSTDALVSYKGVTPVISFEDRIEIVRSISVVDAVVPQETMDKAGMCRRLGASLLFVGDDWYGTDKWQKHEDELAEIGVKVVYFPYTPTVSSTALRAKVALENGRV